jgi:hypothetical protein
MAKIKNISTGARGAWAGSALVMVEPGATAEGDFTDVNPEWFEGDGVQAAEPGPLDGNVDDLTAHLATVDDLDEVQRLLDAETAGKSRKGALAAIEARRDELLAA